MTKVHTRYYSLTLLGEEYTFPSFSLRNCLRPIATTYAFLRLQYLILRWVEYLLLRLAIWGSNIAVPHGHSSRGHYTKDRLKTLERWREQHKVLCSLAGCLCKVTMKRASFSCGALKNSPYRPWTGEGILKSEEEEEKEKKGKEVNKTGNRRRRTGLRRRKKRS